MHHKHTFAIAVLLAFAPLTAHATEPLRVRVDCDAGDNLALAIHEAAIRAGRLVPADRALLGGEPPAPGLPRPIEVEIAGRCVIDLRVTTSDITLRGVTDDAAIVGSEEECDPRPGAPLFGCPALSVVGATGVLLSDLAIVQETEGRVLSTFGSHVTIERCHLDTVQGDALTAVQSQLNVSESSITGAGGFSVRAVNSHLYFIFSEVFNRTEAFDKPLVAVQDESLVRFIDSDVHGDPTQGRCRVGNHSRLEMILGTRLIDVAFEVVESSSLSLSTGFDRIPRIEAVGFSDLDLNADVDELVLRIFSRAILASRSFDSLHCEVGSEALCPDGAAVIESDCGGCPADAPATLAPNDVPRRRGATERVLRSVPHETRDPVVSPRALRSPL